MDEDSRAMLSMDIGPCEKYVPTRILVLWVCQKYSQQVVEITTT